MKSIVLVSIACAAAAMTFLPSAQAATFFVAPNGSDAGPGTLARPFATLARAQAAARQAHRRGAVTVTLRGGIYHLTRPLVFTPEDSGTAKAPIVYQAYESEKPVLSGAVPLHLTWTPDKNGIFQAKLPAGYQNLAIDQLFVNGQLQQMARYPNYDSHAQYFNGVASDVLSPERVKGWANPTGGYVHALHAYHWGSLHYRIDAVNPDGALKLEGGWQTNRPADMSKNERFVENIFEELDAPGEWYLNKAQGILYLMPEAGVDLSKARVEGAVLPSLVEFRGSQSAPVRFVSLRGLTFTQTARTFMLTKEPILRSDWAIYRGGTAFLEGTENCAIQDCDFLNVGGNAVFFSSYNRHSLITGCKIADAGASGICFVGDPAAVRDPVIGYDQSMPEDQIDTTPGPKTDNYPGDCTASDNLITRIGRIEKQSAGVEIDMAQDITVSHCSIYDVPRAGINIGDGCWGGHVVEFCDVFDTVKESGDHGSFNSWGRDRYWHPDRGQMDKVVAAHPDWFKLDVVKPITLRNSRWVCRHGWDIDLDDGSSNYIIVNNLCLGGGIKNREGAFRDVENNVIPNNSFHPHVWFHDSQDVFARNIVGQGYHPAGDFAPWWGKELDDNLFATAGDLHAAQSSGHDAHSQAGDPLFVNPALGDYRVKDGSPALPLGFKNFPMDQFGVVSPRLRAQAKNGLDFADSKPEQAAGPKRDATVHVWLGAKIKNVTELGEQSVAALPGIEGVMVQAVPAGSAAASAGFRPLDVIWTLSGKPVPDYAAFMQRSGTVSAAAEPASVQIYRGQKLVTITVPAAAFTLPVNIQVKTSGAGLADLEADLSPTNLIGLGQPGYLSTTAEKVSNPCGGANADALRNGTTKNGSGSEASVDDGKTIRGYGEGDTVTFPLNTETNPRGYDLTKILTFAGHPDSRASQNYSVSVSFVAAPAQFVLLVPSASAASDGGSSELVITDPHGGILTGDKRAAGVAAVRFDFHDGSAERGSGYGYNLYREIQIIGAPTE